MSDRKFTDDEIIHSLKVCSNDGDCSECLINPHKGNYGYCTSLAIKAALDLINRQKAEITRLITSNGQLEARVCEDRTAIESLNTVYADMTESLRLAAEANKDMEAEIERLESLCEKIGIANDAKFERICVLQEDLETAKSEAIKEFAEKLKKAYSKNIGNGQKIRMRTDIIDTLVKEMTEENKR